MTENETSAEASGEEVKPKLFNRDFSILWLGLVQSAFGDAFLAIGLMWLVLEKTGSPIAASTILILEGLPKIFGPMAGVIVDRSNKKHLMIASDVLRGGLLVALFVLDSQGFLPIYLLYAVAALEGALSLFYKPCLRVVLPTIVPDSKLTSANSGIEAGQHIATILGTALAGLSLTVLGVTTALLIDGVTFFLAAAAISAVRFPPSMTESEEKDSKKAFADLAEGLRYISTTKEIVLLVTVVFMANFVLSPVNVIFPVFSREVLGAGVQGFGFLASAVAIGLLIGSIVASIVGDKINYRWMILNGLAMMGLALFGLGSIQTLWLAVAIAGLLGAVAITIQVPLVSHLQRAVPQKLQGRVFATMTAVVALATPLGAAVFGQALEKIAVSKVFLLGAGGCLTVAFIWWIFGIVRGVGLAEHGNEETSDPESLEEGSETAGDAAAPVAREADSRS